MSAHTTGPWEPRQNESGMYVTCVNEQHVDSDGDPTDICSVENEGHFGSDQAWANCRLIAAAPELFWALQQVLVSVGHGDAKEIARAALAKAGV